MRTNLILVITILLIFFIFSSYRASYHNLNRAVTKHIIKFQGKERIYLLHLPPDKFLEKPVPVLFCLHGGGGNAKSMIGLTYGRFNELSDLQGFIVVYPQAFEKHWNDGRKDNFARAFIENIDDVGFISEIIDELIQNYKIDDKKIFTCGMSNGGFMSAKLACELSGKISGAAIIAATMGAGYFPLCKPQNPLKIIYINGTEDPLVPYNGGEVTVFRKKRGKIISTDDAIHFWAENNGCRTSPIVTKLLDVDPNDGTFVEKSVYSDCQKNTSVIIYKIINGGHTWPGGKPNLGERIVGKTCNDFNACDEICNFFK